MMLARLRAEIGKGTHTPYRTDNLIGTLANAAFYAAALVLLPIAAVWLTLRFLWRTATRQLPA